MLILLLVHRQAAPHCHRLHQDTKGSGADYEVPCSHQASHAIIGAYHHDVDCRFVLTVVSANLHAS